MHNCHGGIIPSMGAVMGKFGETVGHPRKLWILLAVALGIGFASALALLLNVPVVAFFAFMLLFPGGLPVALLTDAQDIGPLALILANALVYSGVAYLALVWLWPTRDGVRFRRAAISLSALSAVLFGLTFIPTINPLWPVGMDELAQQEKDLRQALPVGLPLEQARAVLTSRGIEYYERISESNEVVLERQDERITAAKGDRVLSARPNTDASQFPCWYALEIVLVVSNDQVQQRYINRFRLCP